jgi:PadR family transcriptional regulator PadR
MNIENTQSQMRKGVLEFCILSIIQRGEAYPSDIIEEMKKSNLQLLEGTLYPLLTRLKNADLLNYRWVESSGGPPRKYFSLTEKGTAFYQLLENTWREMADGVERVINSQGRGNSEEGIVKSEELIQNRQPTPDNPEPTPDNPQLTTDNPQLTTDNPKPKTDNSQPTTNN